MTDEEAALVEPVAVAVMAVKKARVTAGSVVLIHGAGPVGLCMYMVAKAVGSVKTIFCDINKKRLDFAKTMGDDIETVLLDPATKELKSVEERKAEYTNETSQARKLAARIIETANAGEVILDNEISGERLAKSITRAMDEPENLRKMEDNSYQLGSRDATEKVRKICEDLMKKEKNKPKSSKLSKEKIMSCF